MTKIKPPPFKRSRNRSSYILNKANKVLIIGRLGIQYTTSLDGIDGFGLIKLFILDQGYIVSKLFNYYII